MGWRRPRVWGGLLATACLLIAGCSGDDGGGADEAEGARQGDCPGVEAGWVAVWGASPTGASNGTSATDAADASGQLKSTTRDETARAVLTPTFGGREARVRLSNRFGPTPVPFDHVTIARRDSGASVVPETIAEVTFDGESSVVAGPREDVVSDPVEFAVTPFEAVAVSVYVPDDVGKPTEHFAARQTSYLTPEDAGDHAADPGGGAFTETTTTRPFVTGLDVRSSVPAGAVVAFGDSITDGYQGEAPTGAPESREGIDEDGRYPDALARRLHDADLPLAVVNAGISGNRVLQDGIDGPIGESAGPAALERVGDDVLAVPGATSVILLAGINDLGMPPFAEATEVIEGYERLIGRLQGAGLHVLHGTLTPAGGSTAYGTPEIDARRTEINEWIRTESPADEIIDFDAVVRDPAQGSRLAPELDGGDRLHFNLAGNQALAEAVPLDQLETCRPPT